MVCSRSLTTARPIRSFLNNVGEGNRLEGTFPNELHPQFPPSAPVGTCEFWEVSLETLGSPFLCGFNRIKAEMGSKPWTPFGLTRSSLQRYDLWDEDMKSSLRDFARAQMDAFQVRTLLHVKVDRAICL